MEVATAYDEVAKQFALWVPIAVLIASAVSTMVPSTNKVMKVIDAIALNWGKARNDPKAQGGK